MPKTIFSIRTCLIFVVTCWTIACGRSQPGEDFFDEALQNANIANEGFTRCNNYVTSWLSEADPVSGLIPCNLTNRREQWTVHNAAADNYPFMVLTTSITDSSLFGDRMIDMLQTEIELTSRVASLPDNYSFTRKDFVDDDAEMERIIFGASEYVKDGLLPITEWFGVSPWSDRMLDIVDDVWANATIETRFGIIPSNSIEVNGEQLQILARIYWMTGNKQYLDWAVRLGDYYLLDKHPTRDFDVLRLRNHGCEIVTGLCELYATVNYAMPDKKKQYEPHIHEMLDTILQKGRNRHGMFYNSVNPSTGDIIDDGISDTWGYVFNGFYTVYLLDNIERYRDTILFAVNNLNDYRDFDWENGRVDGFADAVESAINMYYREPEQILKEWIDSEARVMWSRQDSSLQDNTKAWHDSGIIDGDHCDGNFARTSIMYCLWKTQGVILSPWRQDVIWGAVRQGHELYLVVRAAKSWQGRIFFDKPRHKTNLKLPMDWPRINQFPEWFVIEQDKQYDITEMHNNVNKTYTGSELKNGLEMHIQPGTVYKLKVTQL
jgi:hypothetical protein